MSTFNSRHISVKDIDLLIFDFDGVLTDNKVLVDQDGKETVICSRSDGLAFDVLRKINKDSYIFSTEKNSVVSERAKKLQIPILQNVANKERTLKVFVKQNGYKLDRILYVGDDLNDYRAMELCGFSVCPSDSHPFIKQIATIVLSTPGGGGVVRELVEDVLGLNFLTILYE